MSSSNIPVRKGTRRSITTEGKPGLETTISPPNRQNKPISKENKDPVRPLTRQSSKKELWDNNMKLKEEIKLLEEKQREMDAVLNRTKNKLEQVQAESSQEEKNLKETIQDWNQKFSNLQTKMNAYEKKLLTSHIDPVTLKSLENDSTQLEETEEKHQVNKLKITQLQNKFKENNSNMTDIMTKLKGMDIELDEIIATTESNLNAITPD